jgi:hypothetical protein
MKNMFKTLVYGLLVLSVYFPVNCSSAGEGSKKTGIAETPVAAVDIGTILVLDAETDISSPWVNRFLLTSEQGTFFWNNFSIKRGEVKLENSSTQYGMMIRSQTKIEQFDSFAIHQVSISSAVNSTTKSPSSAFQREETVSVTFSLSELVNKGQVIYQPARFALLKSIKEKKAAEGQAYINQLEYLKNGHFKADVIIKY